jgi:unsaturated rhamnogalacturonyl hydrolase
MTMKKYSRPVRSLALACSTAGLLCMQAVAAEPEAVKKEDVVALMRKVADRQLPSPDKYPKIWIGDWSWGPFVHGLMALGKIPGNERYTGMLLDIGRKEKWQVIKTAWYANDHCTPQSYLELYETKRDPVMLAPAQKALDAFMTSWEQSDDSLEYVPRNYTNKWSWIDALYMSPPTYVRLAAVTGDRKYRDFVHKWWWKVSDYYYDTAENLYVNKTDQLKARERNKKKVFWCRGNGWVVGGLVRVLQYLPKDDPFRPRYEKQFVEMCGKLAEIQLPNGLWSAGLLDPVKWQPESSGSGFFIYGMAYGINEGLLDKAKFLPVVMRGWQGLAGCVSPQGEFQHVQPVGGGAEKFDPHLSAPYGSGAFLLAGSEVYRMLETKMAEGRMEK